LGLRGGPKRLRISVVAPYSPPVVGGTETYISELVKRFSKETMSASSPAVKVSLYVSCES